MPSATGVVVHVATGVFRAESVLGLGRLARELGLPALALDLGGVYSLTAAGLGNLLALQRELRDSGAALTLLNVCDAACRVIEAAGLTGVLGVQARRVPSARRSPRPPAPRRHPAGRSRRSTSLPRREPSHV